MNPEQYQSAFENTTDLDLSDFMEDLIFSPGFSSFVIDSTETVADGDGFATTFYIQQKLREAPALHDNVPLDFTLLDGDWQKHSFNEMVSGQYSTVEVYTEFEPQLAMLNGEDRINQARMAYDAVLFETTTTNTLPWVDMKLKVEAIGDTSFYRAVHHWVGPDQELMSDDVLQLSTQHYWTISGLFSEGLDLSGRFYYHGFNEEQLDYELVGETEANVGLVYREDPSSQWDVYPYYTLQAGSDNGNGTIKIDSLIAGEFAFANINQPVGISEFEIEESLFQLFPNPSSDVVFIRTDLTGNYTVRLVDQTGKILHQEETVLDRVGTYKIDLQDVASGAYVVQISSKNGKFEQQLSLIKQGS